MCLSGDVYDLADRQWSIVEEAIRFYGVCAPVIKNGRNYRQGPYVKSYQHLRGWQAVCRKSTEERQMLVVAHTFEEAPEELEIVLPKTEGAVWKVSGQFCRKGITERVQGERLFLSGMTEYDGAVLLLNNKHENPFSDKN